MWILRNKDQLGGKIYSLGLLPKVIGQALEGKGSSRKREEQAQEARESAWTQRKTKNAADA